MATLSSTLHFRVPLKYHRNKSFPATVPTTKFQPSLSLHIQELSRTVIALLNTDSVKIRRRYLVSNAFKRGREYCHGDRDEIIHVLKRWVEFIWGVFPGGSWWILADNEREIGSSSIAAKSMRVLSALNQMWALINHEKGLLYTSFGALTIAA